MTKRSSAASRAAEFMWQNIKEDVKEVREAVGVTVEGMTPEQMERHDFCKCFAAVAGTGFALMFAACSLINFFRGLP